MTVAAHDGGAGRSTNVAVVDGRKALRRDFVRDLSRDAAHSRSRRSLTQLKSVRRAKAHADHRRSARLAV
ncbi:hypothetical protein WS86_22660 [Burkholderia savannae]|nr:hypothetical protein WS86_22660 [Burkholderia savannae]